MINVENPSDGSIIGQIPDHGAKEAKAAIGKSAKAFERWSQVSREQRNQALQSWHKAILANIRELSDIIAKEAGKPLAQAKAEVEYAASFVEWFAKEALRDGAKTIPGAAKGIALETMRKPIGVCYAATPWNFPAAMVTRKVAPAIAAGCSVILKPSELTPLTALKLAELFEEKDVLTVLTGMPEPITNAMMESDVVRKISFTGSTPVGMKLMEQSAKTLKRLSLELGGNAPFIVLSDANMDEAVKGLLYAKFRNTGQNCISPNRVLVQKDILEAFLAKLLPEVDKLQLGEDYGPLIHKKAVEKVERLVENARKSGAKLLLEGGEKPEKGYWVRPVVMTNVTTQMDISCEEIFGPVIAITTFENREESFTMANATPYGLAAYIYTGSEESKEKAKEAIHTGMLGVNTTRISWANAPFGGVKHSGFGREGGHEGIEEYQEIRLVCTSS